MKVKVEVGEVIYPHMTKICGSKQYEPQNIQQIVIFSMRSPKTGKRVYYTTVNLVKDHILKALKVQNREMLRSDRIPWGNILSYFGHGLKIFIKGIEFKKRAIRLEKNQAILITEVREKSAFGKIVEYEVGEDNAPTGKIFQKEEELAEQVQEAKPVIPPRHVAFTAEGIMEVIVDTLKKGSE